MAPSQRDFANRLHMRSIDVLPHLQALAKRGYFKRSPGRQARSFKFELVEEENDHEESL
jgi:DNA-binding MarR family transcriptional regulator